MSNKGRPPATVTSKTVTLERIDALREGVFEVVADNIPVAREVLSGRRVWTNGQTKLFLDMLNKVMPNLTHTHRTTDVNIKPPDQWTNEELAAFLEDSRAASATLRASDIIDADALAPQEYTPAPVDEDQFAALEALSLSECK